MKKLHGLILIAMLCSCGCGNKVQPPPGLLGKWQDAENLDGMEFTSDGSLTIVRDQVPPVVGKYRFPEAGLMEVDLGPSLKEPVKVKVSIAAQELTLTAQVMLKDAMGFGKSVEVISTWQRVSDWTLTRQTRDATPREQRRRLLIGKWQSADDGDTWDFYDDGTFAHTQTQGTLSGLPHFRQGTYDLAKGSAQVLTFRFPDTGRAETRHACVTPREMLLGREGPEGELAFLRAVTKYRRAGNPTPDYRPVRADALTAYQLHHEWQTDSVVAAKKFKGKEVQIVGMASSSSSSSFSESSRDADGKPIRQDSAVTKLFLATGEGQNVLCLFNGKFNQNRIKKILADKSRLEKPLVIKGQCVGLTNEQGEDVGFFQSTIDGDSPKVRLDHCSLVEDAPTQAGDE